MDALRHPVQPDISRTALDDVGKMGLLAGGDAGESELAVFGFVSSPAPLTPAVLSPPHDLHHSPRPSVHASLCLAQIHTSERLQT